MDINEWISEVTGDTARDISRHTGISERTLQHQLSTGRMSVENAVKISAAYGRHPLRTLIDLGVVDAAWAQVPDIDAALDLAPDDKLIEQLEKRLKRADAAGRSDLFDTPISDLDARRSAKSNDQVPPRPSDDEDETTVRDYRPHLAAADGSIDEDAAQEEAGVDPLD